MRHDLIEQIHENLVNGNRTDCVKLIKKYGLYDFWDNYKNWLSDICDKEQEYLFFQDMTISYFRIISR